MVKESTGDIGRMHRLAQLSDGEIPFYNGSNPMALAALAAGAAGWCTAAPNLNAALPLALFDAMQAGDRRVRGRSFMRSCRCCSSSSTADCR